MDRGHAPRDRVGGSPVNGPKSIVQRGGDSWFFLTADFAFGHAMQRDSTHSIEAAGGKVVGGVRLPLNTADFASFLLQAQSSRTKGGGVCQWRHRHVQLYQAGDRVRHSPGRAASCATSCLRNDVHALGLAAAQGLLLTTSFYWDRTDESRKWSKRFFARRSVMPTQTQAGVYSAVTHYLKAVDSLGSDEAKAVVAKMRDMPIRDFFADHDFISSDGRMAHDMYLVEVKKPDAHLTNLV
jgi:branched-chain amino acid transport system substrate-binding protein